MNNIFLALAAFFIIATVLPLFKHDVWWVRIFEFPRLQLAILALIIVLLAVLTREHSVLFYIVFFVLIICFGVQIMTILPYTRLHPVQVLDTLNSTASESIKIIIANVYMDNNNFSALSSLVRTYKPDIFLAVEVNHRWHNHLQENINYKYVVAEPLNNTYGMALYSNLTLLNPRIKFLIDEDIPSIHTKVELNSKRVVHLHCLHPKPPAPQESTETTERDAELLLVGKQVKKHGEPSIVLGDLNDVAWSYTTTLFQKISGLLDPRVGRGMFNSFHAKIPFLRFPLDHAFASKHFKVHTIKRLPSFESDHFPIMINFSYSHDGVIRHTTPKADKRDKKLADDKIEDGLN